MKTTSFPPPRRRVRLAGLAGCLALLGVALGGPGAPDPARAGRKNGAGPRARKEAQMVDNLANRNKPPKIVKRPSGSPRRLPLYPRKYDWREEARVRRALKRLASDRSQALWEELVRRIDDRRYCVVNWNDVDENAELYTVGDICWLVAHNGLFGLIHPYLPSAPGKQPEYACGIADLGNLAVWRKKRAGVPLYRLQLEICHKALAALDRLVKEKLLTAAEKVEARKGLEAEVAKLRRTRRPVFTEIDLTANEYDREDAVHIRKVLKSHSSEMINLAR
jgi:hypothetical protein